MLKFLKINLNKSPKFLDSKFHDSLEYLDKHKLEVLTEIEAVEFEVSGKQVSYVIVTDRQLDNFKYLVDSLGSKILKIQDFSKQVLFDDEIEMNFVDEFGNCVKDKIEKLVLNFKYQATDCDTILDKLLEKGMDSLTEFDKQFLK